MTIQELPDRNKISQKFIDVAEWYIVLSQTKEECERRLLFAVDAWNIACINRDEIEISVKNSIEKFKKSFNLSEIEKKELEKNLGLMIKKKRNMYPKEIIIIKKAVINLDNGQFKITVEALDLNLLGKILDS